MKRIILTLFVLALAGCSNVPGISLGPTSTPTPTPLPPTETPIPFAISVDGTGITPSEYEAELARYGDMLANQNKQGSDEEVHAAVNEELIGQLLLANAATSSGFELADSALQDKVASITEALGGKDKLDTWLQSNHYDMQGFESALRRNSAAAWMRDKISSETNKTAEQVHIQQLLLYEEDTAKYYFDQLSAGADFDTLAIQIDPVTRGDIGWFPQGYIPDQAIEAAAFGLEVGQTSEIIKGDVGFYILKCLDKSPDRELSPDALAYLQKLSIQTWVLEQKASAQIFIQP